MKITRIARGFTLVELLITIVVVGVLASVAVVGYNGVQARARDMKIRSAAETVKDALEIYISRNGRAPKGGWGSSQGLTSGDCIDGANGWLGKDTYACTPEEVLVAAGLMPSDLISSLPPNKVLGNSYQYVFMLYTCGTNKVVLMWYLESPTSSDVASYDDNALAVCGSNTYRTSYGMQASAIFNI